MPPDASVSLLFASYNIHKSVGLDARRDPERIIAVLREIDADVIALQEVDRRVGRRQSTLPRQLLDDTPWMPLPVSRRRQSLGWHGNALLVRRSARVLACGALDLPTLEPRGAVMGEMGFGEARFVAIGTHLDLSGLRRRDQIRALKRFVAERFADIPCVILGDFNQWGHASGAMREFARDWQALAPGPSFPARNPIARLDRIVASYHWRVELAAVHHSALAAKASDHLPIVARLSLPN